MATDKGKSEEVVEPNVYQHEEAMGKWVADRCRKRAKKYDKPMDPKVVEWLETGGNSPPTEDTPPSSIALGWVIKTIENPAWAE